MKDKERSLIDDASIHVGKYGGFPFGGEQPRGIEKYNQLPPCTKFPNGATSAVLLTFDVEGNYGNGAGDIKAEISNYSRICDKLSCCNVPATFNIVGQMVEDYGGEFVEWMLDAGSEVAPHGYVHDMNKRYGGDKVYAGQYAYKENFEQISDGINAIENLFPGSVSGIRMPYAYFNEYTYDAIEKTGLKWASNTGIDDFLHPGNGFGNGPFQIKMGEKLYTMVEIPLDTQTFDWAIWMADATVNRTFTEAVEMFCRTRDLEFTRTPKHAVKIWEKRVCESIENETVFTLLCHPVNFTVESSLWKDPVDEFLLPVIERLSSLESEQKVWLCTSLEMSEFYHSINWS